jgi:hypothetical protein
VVATNQLLVGSALLLLVGSSPDLMQVPDHQPGVRLQTVDVFFVSLEDITGLVDVGAVARRCGRRSVVLPSVAPVLTATHLQAW